MRLTDTQHADGSWRSIKRRVHLRPDVGCVRVQHGAEQLSQSLRADEWLPPGKLQRQYVDSRVHVGCIGPRELRLLCS